MISGSLVQLCTVVGIYEKSEVCFVYQFGVHNHLNRPGNIPRNRTSGLLQICAL